MENLPARISAELAARLKCDEHALRESLLAEIKATLDSLAPNEGQHRMAQTFRDKMIFEIRWANPKKSRDKQWMKQQIALLDATLEGLKSDKAKKDE